MDLAKFAVQEWGEFSGRLCFILKSWRVLITKHDSKLQMVSTGIILAFANLYDTEDLS